MGWRIIKYLTHQFYLRYRKGYGIHSPYLFEFIHDVVFNTAGTTVPDGVLSAHKGLLKDHTPLPEEEFPTGAGSRVECLAGRTVRSFAKGASVSLKYGALLYRISRWFNPDILIEMGTGVGVSTLYLASGSPGTPMITVEGNRARAEFSASLIKRCGLDGVKVHRGDFDEWLTAFTPLLKGRWLLFLDGNHRREPTLNYLGTLVKAARDESVIILDDLYWSREMYRAWKEVIQWPEVRVSIDLYHTGILLLRRDLSKAAIKVRF